MKFFTTSFFLLFLFSFDLFANESKFYSISTCTSTTHEDALRCKNLIKKSASKEIYIIQSNDNYFRTTIGKFDSYKEIKQFEKTLPKTIKDQTPFIKEFHTDDDSILFIEKYLPNDFDLALGFEAKNEPKDQNTLPMKETKQTNSIVEIHYQEDTIQTPKNQSQVEITPKKTIQRNNTLPTKNTPKIEKKEIQKPLNNTLLPPFEELKNYEMIYIKVDSKTNKLNLEGVVGNKLIPLAQFVVSTGRKTIEKPTGVGKITSISLAPNWYPTQKTIDHFKESKGIELPKVVPAGDKYNYMGAAKINLSHRVEGKEIYRIHGTLDETTIGTNESSGCIRMKNNEVLALAKMLKKYMQQKGSKERVKVFLK